MEKPDIKKIGLEVAEDAAMSVVEKIVKPYAEYYAVEKGGAIGQVLSPFVDELVDYLKKDIIDQIDGEDDIK